MFSEKEQNPVDTIIEKLPEQKQLSQLLTPLKDSVNADQCFETSLCEYFVQQLTELFSN